MLRKRLLVYFVIISIIPVLVLSIFHYQTFTDLLRKNAIQANVEQINALSSYVDNLVSYMIETANQLQNTMIYKKILRHPKDSYMDVYTDQVKANVELLTSAKYRSNIDGLYILGNNGTVLRSTYFSCRENNYTDLEWYHDAISKENLYYLGSSENSYVVRRFKDSYLTFSIPFYDSISDEKLGIIVFEISDERIINSFPKNASSNYIAITNDQAEIILSNENGSEEQKKELSEYVCSLMDNDLPYSDRQTSTDTFYETTNNYIIHATIDTLRWNITNIIPKSIITNNSYFIIPETAVIIIIVLLISILLAVWFSRKITKPIQHLSESMAKIEKGDYSVRAEIYSEDEIGALANNFNSMIQTTNNLIDDIKASENKRRHAELRALQAQINPHFLYNTLDSIIWLTYADAKDDVISLTKALTTFFRISISKGKDIIPIEEEIKHVENYIIIQKIRYPNQFNFSIIVDEEAKKYLTLKLVLQPIVENAIYHGIKESDIAGLIQIRVYFENDLIVFEVSDNGIGISDDIAKSLTAILKANIYDQIDADHSPGGYGLLNINNRIKLFFGEKYGITFSSKKGMGSTFWIRFPMITEQSFSLQNERFYT